MSLALSLLSSATSPSETQPDQNSPTPAAPTLEPDRPPGTPSFVSEASAGPEPNYRLEVRLDQAARTLDAAGFIEFTNHTKQPLGELWLHLYLNAFKHSKTLFARSPFSAGRSGAKPSEWGYCDVLELVDTRSERDLWPDRDPHSPGDPLDETNIRVPLAKPLPPGERLRLRVRFQSKLPKIVERTGYSGDYIFAAQWFPKLAKLELTGVGAPQFRDFAFHPQAEFYADFGNYDIELDLPDGMVVGATGTKSPNREGLVEAGRQKHRFKAERVHDFAFTAWPDFLVHEQRIAEVDVRILFPPGHQLNRDGIVETLQFALPHFGQLYGSYPYPNLTVVHPPRMGENSGGMEYPTLITVGGRWHQRLYSRALELVTIHELAHQWFYGTVASDEARWPFLDEGLASYSEAKAIRTWLGPSSAFFGLGTEISAEAYRRASAASRAHDVSVALTASEFPTFSHLGALVYNRTATILETLEAVYGDRFAEAMHDYATSFRFQHPTPNDLLATFSEHLGPEPAESIRKALFERGWVDFHVAQVESARPVAARGLFGSGKDRQALDSPAQEASTNDRGAHVGRVLVVRRGNIRLPVVVELYDASGNVTRQHWDGQDPFTFLQYEGDSALVGAVIDPERRITLDQDLTNNSKFISPRGGSRAWERLTYVSQLMLHFFGL